MGSAPTNYALAGWIFLRLLGMIYAAAFSSLAVQVRGLAGKQGILPAADFLAARTARGWRGFFRVPTLFWWKATDQSLLLQSWGGAALGLLVALDVAPLPCLVLCWALYLSLFSVCRLFLSYQWDVLLLEAGFLAILFAPQELAPRFPPLTAPAPVALWLSWWLLFRLMFSSGVVKLRSRDVNWRRLSALSYHFQTQPLPTVVAWYAHQLPRWSHQALAALMFVIELLMPFAMLFPGPPRYCAAAAFLLLMLLIQFTGNYGFFNLLGAALSVLLLNDTVLSGLWPSANPMAGWHPQAAPVFVNWIAAALGAILLILSAEAVFRLFRLEVSWSKGLARALDWLGPFHLVNSYGLFAVMTTERPELIVEGSSNGEEWREYEFRYKPGEVRKAPRFIAPHQPRLDWQMWFAALGFPESNPWFLALLNHLLEGEPAVLSLLAKNPFPNVPPRYIRGVLYDYRFTTRAERRQTGAWWRRERRGLYSPVIELNEANGQGSIQEA